MTAANCVIQNFIDRSIEAKVYLARLDQWLAEPTPTAAVRRMQALGDLVAAARIDLTRPGRNGPHKPRV